MSEPAERALAIVGLSAILPGAPDVGRFWSNLKEGRYSIGDVPPERWDPELYYDSDPAAPGKTYSKLGGFVREWEWEPMQWRLPIPPKVADSMDEAQKWAVACARSVLLDYGHPDRALDFERTAVVVGTAMAGDLHYWTSLPVFFPEYARALREAPSFAELPDEIRARIEAESHERLASRFPAITEDSMPGELANCIAGRIANLFDFHGPNFVCDAACASALAAIDSAREGLITGEYDAALVGGVDRNMGPAPYVKFSKIGALSATGTRPYADGADGFVMGEGAVFFLMKRLADAEASGDRIYAVLRGIGGSSDGRGKGITAPNPAGQRLAIERAWRDAGVSPASAGVFEGHGTSTRVGDVVEFEALSGIVGGAGAPNASVALGSVKSNIGHLKGAAGAAGLLKVVGGLHEKQLLPSLGFERPNPNIDFASSPLYVNTELKPWDPPAEGVRRAGVSAFGFGGTNYHAVLEEYLPGRLTQSKTSVQVPAGEGATAARTSSLRAPLRGAAVLGANDPASLRKELEALVEGARAGRAPAPAAPSGAALRAPERIALEFSDAADLAAKGERALRALDAPAETRAAMTRALRAQGVFHRSGSPGRVAFLYTGQGSQYANMLGDLRESEPVVGATFDEADRVLEPLLGKPLSEILFVDRDDADAVRAAEEQLRRTEITQPAVLTVDTALTRLLAEYGIVPDMVMGHSLGEYGALVASGALPFADALEAVSARGREMASLSVEDNGLMAAVFAPLERIEAAIADVPGNVVVANINSTSQAVIGGATEAVEAAMATLRADDFNVVQLPVSHAFHTSIVSPASEPLRQTLERLRLAPPTVPLIANVSGDPYPMGPDAVPEMIDLLSRQVASPVQFVKGLHTLYESGARVFVEVGPKRALHGFVEDVLGDHEDVLALFTNHPKAGGVASFNQALCGLWAAGVGIAEVDAPKPAPEPVAAAPAPAAPAAAERRPAVPSDRDAELGALFREFLERGAALLGAPEPAREGVTPVVTGAALGLPGREHVFDPRNVQHILDGEQEIDLIPTRFRHAMIDKRITRLVKDGGEPHFEAIEDSSDVIKLAARAGELDLGEFGVSEDRVEAFDVSTQLAIAAGLEALRDAGIPLAMHYRETTTGSRLPERWMLPEPLRDETGVIFAAAFPGFDAFAEELECYHTDHARTTEIGILRELLERARESGEGSVLADEIERRLHEIELEQSENAYSFDRRFLFRILPMAHAQFAEFIGARGPNTHVNSACASTTQAFALASDWIAAGRCRRVVVIAADDATSDHLLEWIGSGFLATGAAATDDVVEKAALPFDRRRHGMILGMGAAGFVIEAPSCADERGLRPICDVLGTVTANSAFHGTRLDVEHIAGVMERLVSGVERRSGLARHTIARELVFVSHETYTPARGGSASAEVEALRRVFGESAAEIVIANTKGLTGHPMGVGIEDAVAVKALETGIVPPVPNHEETDPDLGPLHLSKGGRYPIRYALRLGAGFGSQISMSLLRWRASADGARPPSDALGYATRLDAPERFERWLADATGLPAPEVEVASRTLRVRDDGPARSAPTRDARSAPVAAPPPRTETAPAPGPAATAPAATPAADPDAELRARVLEIVSEKTGYPAEMLELDLDLEADLGIDTVKQAETFAAIREAWGIPRDENLKLRDYPTIAHAIRFVAERRPDAGDAPRDDAAPAAAPAEAPAAPTAGDDDEIRARVLEIVSEKTGYPAEMLELDLDLEADLGIDTVKQAETFAAIREAWGIPRDENLKLRDYPTIAHAIRFVAERRPDAGDAPRDDAAPAAAPAEAPAAPTAGDDDEIRARVLEIVSEKTGYPAEMLELDLDLEADLGIDTVKQAETFAAIREAWGIPRDENLKLRDYPTIAHAIRFVAERRPDAGDAPQDDAAPAAAPAEAPAADDDEIRARVLEIVSEKTGYPAEMLELDLDLEADLGIDTVKQAETFAAIREAWGIPRDENLKLRDYPTIAHAIRFVRERRPDAAPADTSAADTEATEADPHAALVPADAPRGDDAAALGVRRRVPVSVVRPPLEQCKPTAVSLENGARVAVMPDRGGVARALVRRLEARGVEVVTLDPDAGEAGAALERALADGPIRGLYWLPALDAAEPLGELDLSSWRAALDLRVKQLFDCAGALYESLEAPGSFVVSATRLGGRHALDLRGATCPLGGAVTGFTKALARERGAATIKVVDFPASRRTAEPADLLLEETLRDDGAVEIGHADGRRFGVALEERPAETGAGLALGPESVFVITGAAGSIVSAISADLAAGAGGGVFHLLDLTAEPDPGDEDVLAFAAGRDALRRTIFERLKEAGERATPVQVERRLAEIERLHAAASVLAAVRAAGGEAHWHSVDLTDATAVQKTAAEIAAAHERIDVFLHAAGFERSHPIPDKPRAEFDLVFDVKADGYFNLLNALGEVPIGATVSFSSIAGRFGNAGQTDYSAANDLLAKCGTRFAADREGARAVTIDWTAWSGIGMASRGSIPEIMQRAGIDMLPPDAGIPIVRQELTLTDRSSEVVVAGALGVLEAEREPDGGLLLPGGGTSGGPLAARWSGLAAGALRAATALNPTEQPFLDDHRIDGVPVLPGVMGLEGFADLTGSLAPGLEVTALEDVEFLAPFKFYRDEPRTLDFEALLRESPEPTELTADCRLLGARELPGHETPQITEHFRARVCAAGAREVLEAASPPDPPPGERAERDAIYEIYFHGPSFQVLDAVWTDAAGRVVGRLAAELPPDRAPADAPLTTRPRLLELCFQTAGVAEIAATGRLGLPSRIDRVVFPACDAPTAPVTALVERAGDAYDATVVDADGRVLLAVSGYRTMALPGELPESLRARLGPAARAGQE